MACSLLGLVACPGSVKDKEEESPGEIEEVRGPQEPPDQSMLPNVVEPRITRGYVLTHEHPTYGMAFGGNYAFAGARGNYRNGVMEDGYTAECGGCRLGNCDHGELKGSFIELQMGRDMGDHGSEMGPLANSFSHLRYSTEWIEQAFRPSQPAFQDARMRIMVALAVENEAMCEQLYYVNNRDNGGPGGAGYACAHGDSIRSLERQIEAIKAWVAAHSSWMEIAYSAADAKRIVQSDKLAIVLGIESEYSFGAEDRTFDPVVRLQRYYDQGVRTFYLAHKLNSRLAGADIYHPKDTDSGKVIRAMQAISGCFFYDDNVGPFRLPGNDSHEFCDNDPRCGENHIRGPKTADACAGRLGEISEANMAAWVKLGDNKLNGFAKYPLPPGFSGSAGSQMDDGIERNNLGLSADGMRVVRDAMGKGMIINLDHVSSLARRQIARISHDEFDDYPLNALHNNPNGMLKGGIKIKKGKTPHPSEYDFDDDELELIRDSGGIFGLRLGPVKSKPYPDSGVETNCAGTSTESAKILASLLDKGINVGYSLDFATVTQGVHSRTMESCELDARDRIHEYAGQETEGLSHVGVMKKWHKELETVGLAPRYLDRLKNDGADAFIRMWERSEQKSSHWRPQP